MEYQIWLNGEYSDRDKAQIPMLDRGFRIGDVVFDTSRTFNGSVFKLRDHLDRLYRSLKYVRIDPGMSIDDMERITLDVVAHNEDLRREMNDDYMITQIVTGGNSQRGDTDPNVSIWIDPLGAPRWAHAYGGGAHAVIPKTRAYPSEALDPKVKHYSRLNFVLAEMEARDVDPNALPLLLDMDGKVSEGTGANIFIVTDGTLKTPRDNSTLQGVSRMTVMEIADTLGILQSRTICSHTTSTRQTRRSSAARRTPFCPWVESTTASWATTPQAQSPTSFWPHGASASDSTS